MSIVFCSVERLKGVVQIFVDTMSSQSLKLLPVGPDEVNEAVVEEKERDVRSGVRGAHVAT